MKFINFFPTALIAGSVLAVPTSHRHSSILIAETLAMLHIIELKSSIKAMHKKVAISTSLIVKTSTIPPIAELKEIVSVEYLILKIITMLFILELNMK